MPENACLHIQARDADPVRVVTLPGVSVRIGRASYCEVRLPEPEVAEEECHLKRRGLTWQLVPVGRPGAVRIDDQLVEQPRPLPFGVPFRVGDHRLTLQSTGEAPKGWGSFERPISVESPAAGAMPGPGSRDGSPGVPDPVGVVPPEPAAGFDDEEERMKRWKARQEQRASWLETRQEERRWEERWKAAGERLRSRSAAVPTTPTTSRPIPTRRPEAPSVAPRPRASEGRVGPLTRRSEPALPPPLIAKGAAPTLPPVPEIPAVTPATSPHSGRAALAPAGWGKTPIPKRPEPKTAPALPQPQRSNPVTDPEPASPRPLEPTGAIAAHERPQPGSHGEADLYLPPLPGGMEEAFSPTGLTELLVCDHASPPSETQAGLEEEETLPFASPPGDVEDESPRPGPHGVRGLDFDLPREVPTIVSEITHPPCPGETRIVEGPESIGDDLASSGLNVVEEEPATDTGAGSLPDREVDHDTPWVEASIGFDVRERHEGGLFVADTNLGRTGGWPEADLFRSVTATTLDDPEEIIVPRTRPTSGRSRRTSTRPSTSRARPRHETGPAPVAAPPRSSPIDPPREAPTEGPNVKDPPRRLPTAREILSANRAARSGARSSRPATGRRLGTEPSQTICREPAHWTIPLWLGWFPAMVVALVLGAAGIALAWGWSIEAKHAGVIANRLVRGGTKIDPLPEWLTPPEPKWWKTTPGHLALWALERDRTPNDPAAVEEVGELLSAASHASPLQPIVRFALARSAPGPAGAVNELGSSLALSRDVLALAWTGHQLLAAGKKEAALKAYRAAIEMAAKVDLTRLAAPAFFDDPKIRRYALPAEDLIGPIIRDMAGHGGWTYAEWSKALPPFAIAPLVAARVLRDQSVSDADAALDAILGQPDAPPPAGASDAVHLAVHAEALALKGNWAGAEEHYRRAIDRLPEGAIRRSWWINLAEIAYQRNDESNRQKALESAKGGDPNEEITRKAVELLKDYGARTEKK